MFDSMRFYCCNSDIFQYIHIGFYKSKGNNLAKQPQQLNLQTMPKSSRNLPMPFFFTMSESTGELVHEDIFISL